jgi:flagellar biosynthesis/type III secretory pathway M-ring protein FliF/YscJ
VQWEGEGANRKRLLVPPSADTLKTIKDLVAGVTGFDAERGDQLIVETLPFEQSLHSEPPRINVPGAPAKPVKEPPAVELLNKYRAYWAPVGIGAAVLLALAIGLLRMRSKSKKRAMVVSRPELAGSGAQPQQLAEASGGGAQLAAAVAQAEAMMMDDTGELADRVRQLAKRDPLVTANVLRMWLQESKT